MVRTSVGASGQSVLRGCEVFLLGEDLEDTLAEPEEAIARRAVWERTAASAAGQGGETAADVSV